MCFDLYYVYLLTFYLFIFLRATLTAVKIDRYGYLFIWSFTSLSTLHRSYHDGNLGGQRKPVHTVGQGSVL